MVESLQLLQMCEPTYPSPSLIESYTTLHFSGNQEGEQSNQPWFLSMPSVRSASTLGQHPASSVCNRGQNSIGGRLASTVRVVSHERVAQITENFVDDE